MSHPRDRYAAAQADMDAAYKLRDRAGRDRREALADWRSTGAPIEAIAAETGLSERRIEQMIERADEETR